MKKKIPKECKSCTKLWTQGKKDGKHNMWCCAYEGSPAWKQIGRCKNDGFIERVIAT